MYKGTKVKRLAEINGVFKSLTPEGKCPMDQWTGEIVTLNLNYFPFGTPLKNLYKFM